MGSKSILFLVCLLAFASCQFPEPKPYSRSVGVICDPLASEDLVKMGLSGNRHLMFDNMIVTAEDDTVFQAQIKLLKTQKRDRAKSIFRLLEQSAVRLSRLECPSKSGALCLDTERLKKLYALKIRESYFDYLIMEDQLDYLYCIEKQIGEYDNNTGPILAWVVSNTEDDVRRTRSELAFQIGIGEYLNFFISKPSIDVILAGLPNVRQSSLQTIEKTALEQNGLLYKNCCDDELISDRKSIYDYLQNRYEMPQICELENIAELKSRWELVSVGIVEDVLRFSHDKKSMNAHASSKHGEPRLPNGIIAIAQTNISLIDYIIRKEEYDTINEKVAKRRQEIGERMSCTDDRTHLFLRLLRDKAALELILAYDRLCFNTGESIGDK